MTIKPIIENIKTMPGMKPNSGTVDVVLFIVGAALAGVGKGGTGVGAVAFVGAEH